MRRSAGLLATAAVVLTGCSGAGESEGRSTGSGTPIAATGEVQVETLIGDLEFPWDVAQAPDGTLLLDERGGGLTAYTTDGATVEVEADFEDLYAQGESGLMGLVLDPGFADSRRFYTCQADATTSQIKVVSWTVTDDWSSATRVDDPLVGGLPLADGGRHGGCRLRFSGDGALHIGTGDTANGLLPQDRTSLGGKTLRVDPQTGEAWPGNPFEDATNPDERLVYTWGHRNVQGLALRPGTDQMWSAEHGPGVDDEVNLLEAGANYGWNPSTDGTEAYDESVPMTDPDIEGAVPAVWSSGDPTVATGGATFLEGEQWGELDGLLAVAMLKGTGVELLDVAADGTLQAATRWEPLDSTYGRPRTVQLGTDGALYVLTGNGSEDRLLKVTPA